MSYLFIDTETTGVPRNNFKNWDNCYPVQISYIIFDSNQNEILTRNYLIKSIFKSCEESLKIHGITYEERNKKGIDINNVLKAIKEDVEAFNVKNIVSHGVLFDIGLLFYESYRNGADVKYLLKDVNIFCTKRSTLYIKEKHLNGTIEENKINMQNVKGHAHDALYDAYMCSALFYATDDKNKMLVNVNALLKGIFEHVPILKHIKKDNKINIFLA